MEDVVDPRALVEMLPDVVFVVDAEVKLSYVNDAVTDVLGWPPEDWLGRSVLDLVHPDDLAIVLSSAMALRGKRAGTPIEIRVRAAGGGWKWLEVIGADGVERDGVGGLVCVARDLTQRRMWEVAAGETERFQQVVQHASSITLLLDRDGLISSVNGAFTRLLGHDPTLVQYRALVSFATEAAAGGLARAVDACVTSGERITYEAAMRVAKVSGGERLIRFELVNLLDDPVVAGIIVTGHDVSDLQQARELLERLARHDSLTGLANRAVLLERLQTVVDEGTSAAVVFIDLDRFKPVNDLLGHEAGDELLTYVGRRLQRQVRPGDVVARVGGDEFVVLAKGVTDRAMGTALCDRIEAALSETYRLKVGPVRLTASVGLAITDSDSTVAGLLADADLAMYDAKAAARGEPVRSFRHRQLNAAQRRQLIDELTEGLQRGEVVAYLQPVVDLATGATVAVEALARWNHPRLGVLEPSNFLELATDANLDLRLGDVVLESACAGVSRLDQRVDLCVNLSVAQLTDSDLCARLGSILAHHSFEPSRLIVEITEQATLGRRPGPGRASPERTLLDLRAAGVSLALDDFGTGYSSLTHLRSYPLHSIKIDRSFVTGVADQREDQAIISAVVSLATKLGLRVIGEGVETREQLEALRHLGCHAVQGYLICPPLDHDSLITWTWGAAPAWFRGESVNTTAQPRQ